MGMLRRELNKQILRGDSTVLSAVNTLNGDDGVGGIGSPTGFLEPILPAPLPSAQNSVVFRFGRLYDKRNLPEIAVYQYQREEDPPHLWGVLMPVAGIDRPKIV